MATAETPYEPEDRRPIANGFRRLADGPVAWCARHGVHPNAVSYASIVAAALAAICFAVAGNFPLLLIVGSFFCYVRLYFNMLDGMVALRTNQATPVGEIVNELPDRISDVLIFVGVGYSAYCTTSLGYLTAIACFLVAYVGTLGKASGAHRDFSGPMSKPWRMVALSIGACLTMGFSHPFVDIEITTMEFTCLFIVCGCAVTVVRRLRRIVVRLQQAGINGGEVR